MSAIVVIAHNLRSTHNVGSLLRTAEGLGVQTVYFTGYTPYPVSINDDRLPHETLKITKQIHKTSLGAENTQAWEHRSDIQSLITSLKEDGYAIVALEQSAKSVPLPTFAAPPKTAIILGREVEGIEPEILALCDHIVEIPMFGAKESFNVIQAAAMALYHCTFITTLPNNT